MSGILKIRGKEIRKKKVDGNEYFSLTDLAKKFDSTNAVPSKVITRWKSNQKTQEFVQEFELSFPEPQPMISEKGRNGNTWGVFEIAVDLMFWISPKFKVWFIQDYKKMKSEEMQADHNFQKFVSNKNIDCALEILRFEQDRILQLEAREQKALNQ